MSYDISLRFRQRFALEISKLQETVGREIIRIYLNFLSYIIKATAFEPDHSAPSSHLDKVNNESSKTADEA